MESSSACAFSNVIKPDDAQMWSKYIVTFLENKLIFAKRSAVKKSKLTVESWGQLCDILLNGGVNKWYLKSFGLLEA